MAGILLIVCIHELAMNWRTVLSYLGHAFLLYVAKVLMFISSAC